MFLLVLVSVLSGTLGDGACTSGNAVVLSTVDSLLTYARPDVDSSVWGVLVPGEDLELACRTETGWLGFDPGTAQAGNSGSFRYRWVPPAGNYTIAASPLELPLVWGPSGSVPYAMTFDRVPVRVEPDSLSFVADSLPCSSAAGIVSRFGDWFLVDPAMGPSPEVRTGWVSLEDVSISGSLDSVPVLEEPVLPTVGPFSR